MKSYLTSGKAIFTVVVLMIAGLALLCFSACDREERMGSLDTGTVFVHVGSPLKLVGDEVSFLDPEDFGAAAYRVGKKTYVPLAAAKEIFGRDISYDEETAKALLQGRDEEYVFSKSDKSLAEKDGRIFISLAKLAEDVLGNHIYQKDDLIAISKEAEEISPETVKAAAGKIGGATRAKSDAQLKKLMKEPFSFGISKLLRAGGMDGGADMAIAEDMADTNSGMWKGSDDSGGAESDSSFSETNVQVEGIDEADIIKTDGKYVYYSGERGLVILKVEERGLSALSEIKFDDKKSIREMFLDGARLVILGNRYEYGDDYKVFAFVEVYDVSNPGEPELQKSHEMEGNYESSRKKGDHVYLLTNTWGGFVGVPRPLYYDNPLLRDGEDGDMSVKIEATPLEIDRIMVLPEVIQPGYVILSAINIQDDSRTEMEAITAYGGNIYMSTNALYIASFENEDTVIHKFVIDGMNIGYGGTGKVKGHVINQFAMDESKGYFRIATTEWDRGDVGNNLYILDSSLNEVGAVKNFAPGERIYSVRFMGDKGYVVTFKNIDPLFVFDLSDPKAPVITGELKIPGFSNYLHPVGEDLILGIGMETNELIERAPDGTEEVVGFREGGLKVSLFDVSDMGKPREITNLVIGKGGSNSEANYNHKAVMVDASRSQVGFYAHIVKGKDWSDAESGALIINYENNQLEQKAFLGGKSEEDRLYNGFYQNRVIYVGDKLFVFRGSTVETYDYNSFEKISQLTIAL